jgi:hypothetical protein
MAVLSEVQFVVVNTAATATLVATQGAGVKIRVVGMFLVNTTAQSLTFKSGAGGTPITGPLPLGALDQLALPFNPAGWFETAAAAVLELALSGSTQVGGTIQYVTVS